MDALSPNLFDTDFHQLVALARSRLPQHAPGWTDHNLHDPGLMLIEMLAWVTEAQVYAVSRVRSDERWAFGALFGIVPHGPVPARGMAWPMHDGRAAALVAPAGAMLDAVLSQVPAFMLEHAVNITGAVLTAVETRLSDGRVIDHTAANSHQGDFEPFGATAGPDERLVLSFTGRLLAPDDDGAKARDAYLAIGVQVAHAHAGNGPAPVAAVTATLVAGHRQYALPVRVDGTAGFACSGVLLLALTHVPDNIDGFQIAFRTADLAAPPRILCIAANVLPMVQKKTATLTYTGNGHPDQVLELSAAGLCFPGAAPVVRAGDSEEPWQACDDLAAAMPGAPVYALDARRGRIQFGNGVNGRCPASGATVTVDYSLSEGDAGNLAAGLSWTLRGAAGHRYQNRERTAGGQAALDLDQLRRLARLRLREAHPIVTGSDLETAALALSGMHVARAHSLAGDGAQGAIPADWVLVVLRERAGDAASDSAGEPRRWLGHVQRALAPRVLLGERLRVVAPQYVTFTIDATLVLRQGVDQADVTRRALTMLAEYFKLSDPAGGPVWPLGRPVRTLDVKGRLLRVEGVSCVSACTLRIDGQTGIPDVIAIPATGLPVFRHERSGIIATAAGGRP
jgi:hypothetical protein